MNTFTCRAVNLLLSLVIVIFSLNTPVVAIGINRETIGRAKFMWPGSAQLSEPIASDPYREALVDNVYNIQAITQDLLKTGLNTHILNFKDENGIEHIRALKISDEAGQEKGLRNYGATLKELRGIGTEGAFVQIPLIDLAIVASMHYTIVIVTMETSESIDDQSQAQYTNPVRVKIVIPTDGDLLVEPQHMEGFPTLIPTLTTDEEYVRMAIASTQHIALALSAIMSSHDQENQHSEDGPTNPKGGDNKGPSPKSPLEEAMDDPRYAFGPSTGTWRTAEYTWYVMGPASPLTTEHREFRRDTHAAILMARETGRYSFAGIISLFAAIFLPFCILRALKEGRES